MSGTVRITALIAAALLAAPGPRLLAQQQPFDEKARYERALEQKVDEVLIRLLGPNQAKVVVEATMDFTRTEKLEVSSDERNSLFKWQAAGGSAQAGDYLLPGFPAGFDSGGIENRTFNRQTMSPSAFVKKMAVSIILNRDLPEAGAGNVRLVVSEMLQLDEKRGDRLLVIKAPFAPFWRTVWYTPEAMSMVLKYVILTFIAVIAMIVVAVGFLKLAGAMSTMAKVQQSHQITMELGKGAVPGGAEAGLFPAPAAAPGGVLPAAGGTPDGGAGPAGLFNVTLPQVPFLVSMMANEDPANVALLAGHLPQEVKAALLKKLPPAFSSDVIINMAKIRFVDPEVINTLREELEKRLSGAVGGLEGVLAAIECVDLRGKMDMLAEIARKQPELAAQVRRGILLPEDIAKFSDREMSLLAGALKAEEWAAALFEMPDAARAKLKAQLAEKTWQMIEQSMSYGSPSSEKKEEALQRVMGAAAALIREGKIADPAEAPQPLIENAGAGAGA